MDLRDLRNMIEDFDLKRFKEGENAKLTVAVAVAVLLALVLVLTRCGGGGAASRTSGKQYFFDLNTGQLVTVPLTVFSPADVGSGQFDFGDGTFGSGVSAAVISCNDCVGVAPGMTPEQLAEVDAKVGYLTRHIPQVREVLIKDQAGELLTEQEYDVLDRVELLYSTPAGKTWLPETSGPASKLALDAMRGCGDRRPRRCSP